MPAQIIHEYTLHVIKRKEDKVGEFTFAMVKFLITVTGKLTMVEYSPVVGVSGPANYSL